MTFKLFAKLDFSLKFYDFLIYARKLYKYIGKVAKQTKKNRKEEKEKELCAYNYLNKYGY